MSTENLTIDKNKSAADLKELLQGKIDDRKLDEAVALVAKEVTAYPATGAIASFGLYIRVTVNIKDGKHFTGDSGGLTTPGGGALFGDVYTSDINALYNNTVSFAFVVTPVYASVYFFDSSHNLLGNFQAGAVGISTGSGGGTGSWA
jgi:hypothetical protein